MNADPQYMSVTQFDSLLAELRSQGFVTVGPTVQQGAICYDRISGVQDLPRGWTDIQSPGTYRLSRRDDEALFGYVVGPHSWKQYLFPPVANVARADKTPEGWQISAATGENEPRYAFIGVRACEIAAIAIQDKVFMQSGYRDPIYTARRESAFIVAVNCTQSASTCFCESMQTGPRCNSGFDLALTELAEGFVVEVASQRAERILQSIETRHASPDELSEAEEKRMGATGQQKKLPKDEVRDILMQNLQHPHWQVVAQRCLSCTNCTQVCPTCFCSSVTEVADLDAEHVQRQRSWDSCFNLDFSYMHGGAVRNSIRSRYRQWLTHKLGSWHDQFGSSGCVGCGRCITWCPVGIDLTEEVAVLSEKAT